MQLLLLLLLLLLHVAAVLQFRIHIDILLPLHWRHIATTVVGLLSIRLIYRWSLLRLLLRLLSILLVVLLLAVLWRGTGEMCLLLLLQSAIYARMVVLLFTVRWRMTIAIGSIGSIIFSSRSHSAVKLLVLAVIHMLIPQSRILLLRLTLLLHGWILMLLLVGSIVLKRIHLYRLTIPNLLMLLLLHREGILEITIPAATIHIVVMRGRWLLYILLVRSRALRCSCSTIVLLLLIVLLLIVLLYIVRIVAVVILSRRRLLPRRRLNTRRWSAPCTIRTSTRRWILPLSWSTIIRSIL